MARVTDSENWFDIWFEDHHAMLKTMYRNMAADIEAGYSVTGDNIQKQERDIHEYRNLFEQQIDKFKLMDDVAVNRWCFYDMKKRGVIA